MTVQTLEKEQKRRAMKSKDLKTAMTQFVGGGSFIRKYQLAAFMGFKDPNTCNKYLAPLESVGRGYYFIPDVVEAIRNG